jgi:hypothetical protein
MIGGKPWTPSIELFDGETAINEPCPWCGREEEGEWITPCPSDDCPSHDAIQSRARGESNE